VHFKESYILSKWRWLTSTPINKFDIDAPCPFPHVSPLPHDVTCQTMPMLHAGGMPEGLCSSVKPTDFPTCVRPECKAETAIRRLNRSGAVIKSTCVGNLKLEAGISGTIGLKSESKTLSIMSSFQPECYHKTLSVFHFTFYSQLNLYYFVILPYK
jgi:hypothetical protein